MVNNYARIFALLTCVFLSICQVFGQVIPGDPGNFITKWNSGADGKVTLIGTGTGYNYDVYYFKVSDPSVHGSLNGVTVNDKAFTGLEPNTVYQFEIKGAFPQIFINNNNGLKLRLLEVAQWGAINWRSFNNAFFGAAQMDVTATDIPNTANVTDYSGMFRGCSQLKGINANWNWNTSQATTLSYIFSSATSFNKSINSWDVSNVVTLERAFAGATQFNQPLDNWDVGNVKTLLFTFDAASSFNQDINSWNTANVTSMAGTFNRAISFNKPLDNWNTANVVTMSSMFKENTFNQPIGNWDVSKVTDMSFMFEQSYFNQDISGWDVSNVKTLANCFRDAFEFDQDISVWNVASLTDLNSAFLRAIKFNQDLSTWDVSRVVSFQYAFAGASRFNQNLGSWTLTGLSSTSHFQVISNLFANSGMSCENYSQTLIGWANNPLTPSGLKLTYQYSMRFNTDGAAARNTLINDKGWTITSDNPSAQAGTLTCISVAEPGVTFDIVSDHPQGTWSSSNPAIASVDPTSGVVTTHAVGNVELYYTVNTLGCEDVAVHALTVRACTDLDLTPSSTDLCAAATVQMQVNDTGGIWSIDGNPQGLTIDPATGLITKVGALVLQQYIVRYTSTNPDLCNLEETYTFTVIDVTLPTITCPATVTLNLPAGTSACGMSLPDLASQLLFQMTVRQHLL